MIIKNIEIQNLKKIESFKQDFEGSIYLVKGENEVGKSTLLNTIISLITGDRSKNLLAQGQSKGFAKCTVSDDKGRYYEIEIRFSDKNPHGNLKITDHNGMTSNNKTMLENLFRYKDFDANDFVKMSETAKGRREQIELVKSLIDPEILSKIEKVKSEISTLKEERKQLNSEFSSLEKRVQGYGFNDSVVKKYANEIDVKPLMTILTESTQQRAKRDDVKTRFDERKEYLDSFDKETKEVIESIDEEIKRLELKKSSYIEKRKEKKATLEGKQAQAKLWLDKVKDVDLDSIKSEIEKANTHNINHEKVKAFLDLKKELETKEQQRNMKQSFIGAKELILNKLNSSFNLPVEGLEITEDGLTLNGVPFQSGEVSTSQEMMVAAKLIMSVNPTVKVFRLSQGESLGAEKLKALIEFAEKEGYQGFIEEVTRGQKTMTVEQYNIES